MMKRILQQIAPTLLLLGVAAAAACPANAAKMCAVTFRVNVPQATSGTVYVSGSVPALGPWAADKVAMKGAGAVRTATVSVPEGTALQFKFTRGAWSSVETTAKGVDVSNRKFAVPMKAAATYTGTVAGWHDTSKK